MPDVFEIADRFKRSLAAREDAAVREMLRHYRDVERRITERLDRLTAEMQQWRNEHPDEEMPVSWLFERERLQELQGQIEDEIARFARWAAERIEEEQRRLVERAERDAEALAMAAMGKAPSGVIVDWARLPREALEQLVGMLQDGSPLRALLDELGPAASEAIRREFVSGLALGLNPRDVARRCREALNGNRVRAELIARTEMLRAYREAARQSYIANSDVVKGWVWHAARDDRTCFPAGTRIHTRRGQVPIESVHVGDDVLTHTGVYRRVTKTICRAYVGLLVTVRAGGGEVTATLDHPFLVERQGKLDWVEAGGLRLGDTVFCESQGRAYVRDHSVRVEGFGTLLTNAFHAHIIQDVRWHVQSCDVYNLEVEREHSYIANGFVVHNCPMCWAMHGTVHSLDERLDDHPRGRCAMVPLTKTWKELGFEDVPETRVEIEGGETLFARLSEAQQREILGNAAFEAYRAGVVKLGDFVGQKSDPRWGTMRYARSLREILGPREARGWQTDTPLRALGADVNKLAVLRELRLSQVRAMSDDQINELFAKMRSATTLPRLKYHYERHGDLLGVSSQEEYLRLFREHIQRSDLRIATALRPKDQTPMWYLIAVDNGRIAQYNEWEGCFWSFFRTRNLERYLEDASVWWVEAVRQGDTWSFEPWGG